MTHPDLRQTFARVLEQCAGCTGPALGFISEDVALLRADHADRMTRAEAILAENARIVAALPTPRPKAESPARRRIKEKLTVVAARVAELNMSLQLAALRRRLEPPNTN